MKGAKGGINRDQILSFPGCLNKNFWKLVSEMYLRADSLFVGGFMCFLSILLYNIKLGVCSHPLEIALPLDIGLIWHATRPLLLIIPHSPSAPGCMVDWRSLFNMVCLVSTTRQNYYWLSGSVQLFSTLGDIQNHAQDQQISLLVSIVDVR